ncbi:MAG TPA: hypothetical protein VEK08_20030 [Planctomycetota bacterium]|nr:hypothetical protein [Planctomycetota bacterium]
MAIYLRQLPRKGIANSARRISQRAFAFSAGTQRETAAHAKEHRKQLRRAGHD